MLLAISVTHTTGSLRKRLSNPTGLCCRHEMVYTHANTPRVDTKFSECNNKMSSRCCADRLNLARKRVSGVSLWVALSKSVAFSVQPHNKYNETASSRRRLCEATCVVIFEINWIQNPPPRRLNLHGRCVRICFRVSILCVMVYVQRT